MRYNYNYVSERYKPRRSVFTLSDIVTPKRIFGLVMLALSLVVLLLATTTGEDATIVLLVVPIGLRLMF